MQDKPKESQAPVKPKARSVVVSSDANWQEVLARFEAINSQLGAIESGMSGDDAVFDDAVVRRMEKLQERFESVMSQLAAFDDEESHAVQEAKEEFRAILKRYRQSRRFGERLPLH